MKPTLPRLEISEWREDICKEAILTPLDMALVAQLTEEKRLEVDALREGVRVRARSWVGIIRFEQFEVQIVPKLAGENLGLVRMIEFSSGLDALRRNLGRRELQVVAEGSLLDLLILLFANACERIIQNGLRYDYVIEEEALPVLRGRFLADKQFRRRTGRLDRLECRYDEHSSNILDNQILAFALDVCRRLAGHPLVQSRVNRAFTVMQEACSLHQFEWRAARLHLEYDRLNEHYREAHSLAFELLDGLGIKNLFAAQDTRSFAFLLDMNMLFERFVYRFLSRILSPVIYRVYYQSKNRSVLWDATHHRSYAAVRPDLVIEHVGSPNSPLVIDTKYKLYDEHRLDPSDIYQMFLYAYTYNRDMVRLPEALLVYPASQPDSQPLRLEVRRADAVPQARITTLGISIPAALEEITIKGLVTKQLTGSVVNFFEH